MTHTAAAAQHVVAENGFGKMVHTHPFTGEAWTEESARTWRRKCAGSGRSGGRGIRIEHCACEHGADAAPVRIEDWPAGA
jgi:hypothetical protein